MRKGAEILADELALNGARIVYHVPGESFLVALDALATRHPDIRAISCRHENGAAQMAEAHGKLTGQPGVAFVTRSPGATNAVNGVHTAFQDGSPMILIVGQVKRAILEREAFMSYDFRTMFAPMAKWVAQIDDPARIPEFVQRAWATALSGRRGPVVLVVPEDVLEEMSDVPPSARPAQPSRAGAPRDEDMAQIFGMLAQAQRPLVVVGGSDWSEAAREDIQDFAGRLGLPVVTTFRRRDIIDHRLDCYAGEIGIGANPALLAHIKEADFVLMLNDALSDVNTIGAGYMEGFTLFSIPHPKQKIVHVMADHGDLNRVFQVDLALAADNDATTRALASRDARPLPAHAEWTARLRATLLAEREPQPCPGAIDLPRVMGWLRERLPEDAIVTNGVGAYATWSQRYFPHYRLHTQLGPISGSMGYSLPAAIAAKLAHPERVVVDFVGDGCFQMSSEELATAVQYGANIVILLYNNGLYGTIRIHEENRLDGRTNGTDLTNPDFVLLAKAYGAHGERVTTTEEFAPAFERALAAGRPALIEMVIDPEAIHCRYSLSDLRARRAARAQG
ncbi:thiamine pyrophosphate-binding protein [Paracoccus denitrificans]|nr:thiamine pyrophosphate-binding protein [Paracoccus denitrificans]MBB4628379.1 acetolactate synthase-1/2/3 large subunit [Paracoccus denitrificans]MCU7429591.1 thiamine pyrophosphate-binding protein [Paracoccus denitrificans]QAR29397.1 thiamine pyrophosphate-binding protein [Paracoccus denitrificans]UPV98275.1 thiamine pyrophosphate-binding protein [Paracoccus denitrificans]WQO36963.1 thiamine pyrophosphate-binding protein [Paracoccus denitrificans]